MSIAEKIAKGIGIAGTAFAGLAVAVNKYETKKGIYFDHEQGFYEKYIKRPQDLVCATAATVLLSPVMAGTALLVKLKLGSPVLFVQERPGLNEKIFKLYKFRTMTDERDENGDLLPDTKRLTRFGKFLRNTSIDELPELFNIVKGDMSIVGPRPLLVKYLPLYNEEQRHRHSVRPGLTGYAQVHGRNDTSWSSRFKNDVYYVKNVSLLLDISIIKETIMIVLKREGINTEETSKFTMFEFTGEEEEN